MLEPQVTSRNFKRQWAQALFARRDKPAGAIAMAFKLYVEMDAHGRGAVISDQEFSASCGVSDRSVRTFKKWLIDEGYIAVSVKGARGRQSEFYARIPGLKIAAPVAGSSSEIAAGISGNNDEYRQELPANISGNRELPAAGAGIPTRVEYNNYNKNNNLTHSHQETPREREDHIGHGVYVNCDVIRHREFSISVSGIAMRSQASGLTTEEIKTKLTGIALQWAVEIENGRPASEVVPKVVTSALARAIMSDRNHDDIHHVRRSKAAGQRTTVSSGKTVDEMYSDWRTSQ